MTARTELWGGLQKTTSSVWLEEGALKIELYDFTDLAQSNFGHDIARILTVTDMPLLYELAHCREDKLVEWVWERFPSFFEIKDWLKQHRVPFDEHWDDWA